ncbi:ParA family protein [Xanthobacter sp. V13C-7B]|uniref:AAA family ATPase n=1 Tax=Xanthobacter variabilis TaxID=3119932 RepID=UPI003726DA27
MYVISFANPKGGTGKTTAALLLAEQLARAGAAVVMLDCDPNQNIVTWEKDRKDAGRETPFRVVARPPEDQVVETIDAMDGIADYVIVDLEGTAAQIVTFVLSRTDLAIIPFEPTPMETRQAARAVSLVKSTARMMRREIPFTLLFTRTNAAFATSDERDVRAETKELPVLPVSLVRRAAFTRIFREGLMLCELKPGQVSNLDAALTNARDYAQAIANQLTGKEAA